MTSVLLKEEARLLKQRVWESAEKIGLPRTNGNGVRLNRIMGGIIRELAENNSSTRAYFAELLKRNPSVVGLAAAEKYTTANNKEYQTATHQEKVLATCLYMASLILDGEWILDDELIAKFFWSSLCRGNYAAGQVSVLVSPKMAADSSLGDIAKYHQDARKALSSLGAMAKIAKDPKQKEKQFIYKCWQWWQKKPDSYKSKAAFAKDMLTKCEYLTNQKKIEDWCREWGKANPAS